MTHRAGIWIGLVVSCVAAAVLVVAVAGRSAAAPRHIVLYSEPVAARVIDPFRPPAHIGAPGNRGLEYLNPPQTLVQAAAAGWVTFAGQVGGRHAITLQHIDGLRTTYTGLAEVWVTANEQVAARASLGLASGNLHFGARINGHYLDPQILLDASKPQLRARLVAPPG